MKTYKATVFGYKKTTRKEEKSTIKSSWLWLWYHGVTRQKPGKILIRKSLDGRRYLVYPNGQIVRATRQLLSEVSTHNEKIKKGIKTKSNQRPNTEKS